MLYEVELKFPLPDATVWERLLAFEAIETGTCRQVDQYFQHPARNFAETDEALRLRSVDRDNAITYKGPVVDRLAKTRREIQIPFAAGSDQLAAMVALLTELGFRPVRGVAKQRREGTLTFAGRTINWAWDAVPPLGEFLELELIVPAAERSAARNLLLQLAGALSLPAQEPRSYLQMLLEHDRSV